MFELSFEAHPRPHVTPALLPRSGNFGRRERRGLALFLRAATARIASFLGVAPTVRRG